MSFLNATWFHNAVEDWMIALAIVAIVLPLLFALRHLLVVRLRRWSETTDTYWDDLLVSVFSATHALPLAALALYAGSRALELSPRAERLFDKALVIVLMVQVGVWGSCAIRAWLAARVARSGDNGREAMHLGIVAFLASLVLWVVVVLATLNNLGFDITALVASLGIGGVAVALAVQNILGDLFASLSIALDKPFVVGDFIVVDELMGVVKHVGLKTTRVQALSGEELIFSNNDLLKSRIRNYKRMSERRVVFNFGLRLDTAPDLLITVTGIAREVVEAQEKVRFDRAHFKGIGSTSLEFEAVYYMLDADFNLYMDTQQRINLALLERCRELGVSFAYPTQTLHVESLPAAA